ncbi:MAG: hypothetical protein JSU71_02550 [Betaproteobacteria bacterium]|nr:MAG: hypothetical protein JSU71_02550 [Betaproteobacteria bacterium]
MKLSPRIRHAALAIALLVTLWLTFAVEHDEPATSASAIQAVSKSNRGANVGTGDAVDGPLDLSRLKREQASDAATDAFRHQSWYVPPPPPKYVPTPPPPPPPPMAPPVPFSYVGEAREANGIQKFFLSRGAKLYTVVAGDVVEGTYRIDGRIGNTLRLTYLPLNIQQSISIGGAS